MTNVTNRIRGKRNQITGEIAQNVVKLRLLSSGYRCVFPVSTPKKIIRGKTYYCAKVAGDFFALDRFGRGVLVEVKCRKGEALRRSDFEPHQHQKLKEWGDAQGLALVAWVNPEKLERAVFFSHSLFFSSASVTWPEALAMDVWARKIAIDCSGISHTGVEDTKKTLIKRNED